MIPEADPYVPVMLALIIAVIFSLAFVGMSKFFGPHRPSATKESLYECGMPPMVILGSFSSPT